MKRYLAPLAVLALTACGDEIVGPAHVPCDEFLLQYDVAAGDTIETPEGLRYVEIRAGSGEVASDGMIADVNYSGYLLDGTRFDSSCPANRAVLRATVGGPEVIAGFAIGMRGMQPGAVRRIIIPPNLGYGSAPAGTIPPNSTLVFDLHLVGFSRR